MMVWGGVPESQSFWQVRWHPLSLDALDFVLFGPPLDPVPPVLPCSFDLAAFQVLPWSLLWTTLALVDCAFWYDTFWGGHKPWTVCPF